MKLLELGERIQTAREEKGLSQAQLANAIGCSQAALSNYEKGKRRIYLSQLEKLAETLDKPLNYFVESLEKNNDSLPIVDESNLILRIINSIYKLDHDQIEEVDSYIQYLLWKMDRR